MTQTLTLILRQLQKPEMMRRTRKARGEARKQGPGQTAGADAQAQIESLILQYRTAFAQADIESLKTIIIPLR